MTEAEKMMLVPCEEANNYSKILSLFGMEEEGDPVEAIRDLAAKNERMSAALKAAHQSIVSLHAYAVYEQQELQSDHAQALRDAGVEK